MHVGFFGCVSVCACLSLYQFMHASVCVCVCVCVAVMEMVGEDSPETLQMKGYWADPKKMGAASRPKSCEVPNIK